MVRQCAWCLRLIDREGERLSHSPLPKLYEASHGICDICGTQWMEQVLTTQDNPTLLVDKKCECPVVSVESEESCPRCPPPCEVINEILLQVQQQKPGVPPIRLPRSNKLRPF